MILLVIILLLLCSNDLRFFSTTFYVYISNNLWKGCSVSSQSIGLEDIFYIIIFFDILYNIRRLVFTKYLNLSVNSLSYLYKRNSWKCQTLISSAYSAYLWSVLLNTPDFHSSKSKLNRILRIKTTVHFFCSMKCHTVVHIKHVAWSSYILTIKLNSTILFFYFTVLYFIQ